MIGWRAGGRPGGDWLPLCLCSAAATAAGQWKFERGGGGCDLARAPQPGRNGTGRDRTGQEPPLRTPPCVGARPGGSMDLESRVKKVRWGLPAGLPAAPAGVALRWSRPRAPGSGAEWCPCPSALLLPLRHPIRKRRAGEGQGSCLRSDLLPWPRPQAEQRTCPLRRTVIKTLQFIPQVAEWLPLSYHASKNICPSLKKP